MSERPHSPVDVSSLAFWRRSPAEREETYRTLRQSSPVSWHGPAEGGLLPASAGRGFWAVTRHADVVTVSRDSATFSSASGVQFEDFPIEVVEQTSSFLVMDAPRHTQLRRLVSATFTARQIARMTEAIRSQAVSIVDGLLEHDTCDFVEQVSHRMPMWSFSELMGIPEQDRKYVTDAANEMTGWNDPTISKGREPLQVATDAAVALTTAGVELAALRREEPAEDLMTALVNAEVDGMRLTDQELGAFFVLLSVAGNDTSRNTISLGVKAFCDAPDQRAKLLESPAERIGPAVEEALRWATPVMTFTRTATRDVELGGEQIAAGEKVAMFYSSANRDETVFPDPERFDISRDPNPHVAFGGGGVHFCLGAVLARTQLRELFLELFTRVPELELGRPTFVESNFINAVQSMECRVAR